MLVNTSLSGELSKDKRDREREREEQGLKFDNNFKTGENVTKGGIQCVRQSKEQAKGR